MSKALVGGVSLFLLNALFIYLNVYWVLPWTDLPMHFVGGLLVALIPLSFKYSKTKEYTKRAFVVLSVLAVSVIWEWYEIILGFSEPLPMSLYDTVIDLCAALLGGVSAYLIVEDKKI